MSLFKESLLPQATARTAATKPSLTALIVDDEVGNLRVLRAMLGDRFRVLEAGDGTEALELLSRLAPEDMPALILSDQRMPKMTGVELFERLRETLPDTIRIIITGFVDVGAIVDSINRAGIYKFVVKPFDQKQLWLEVERAIEAFELRRRTDAEMKALRTQLDERTRELNALREEMTRLRGVSA